MDRWTDRQTDRETNPVWASLTMFLQVDFTPAKKIVQLQFLFTTAKLYVGIIEKFCTTASMTAKEMQNCKKMHS